MTLVPAKELAARETARWPGESAEYRAARTALLAEEIDLRRRIETVAEHRRALPPGPEVRGDYRFVGEHGPVTLADLFGNKDTLFIYTWMFGPERQRPCPMCTSLLSAWDGEARDVQQRIALAITARSPIDRLLAFKAERGWRHLPIYSDSDGSFSRDYGAFADASDTAQNLVLTRRDGTIRLFWAGEMGNASKDPGQDPRGAPDLMPLWTILDSTPEGRGTDWYPKLDY